MGKSDKLAQNEKNILDTFLSHVDTLTLSNSKPSISECESPEMQNN